MRYTQQKLHTLMPFKNNGILQKWHMAKTPPEIDKYDTHKNPNGHILVDSPSIRRWNCTQKIRRNDINFERRIHMEIMTLIRRGNFDVDSTFKINEISMSSPCGFFGVVSTSNKHNFCTRCFHCIIS